MSGVIMIVAFVAVIVCRWGAFLFRLHASLIQEFLEFAFATFDVDRDAIVFGGVWSNAMAKVSHSGSVYHDIWLNQSEMRSTAALVGGGAAVARKTHKWVTESKIEMAAA